MDFRIELIHVPVSDTDRAIEFYQRVGFGLDHDHRVSEEMRFVQMTPPGSACSIAFGDGINDQAPGSLQAIQMVIDDADATLAHLQGAGIEAKGVDDQPWGRFVYFADPDGNGYTLQQMVSYG